MLQQAFYLKKASNFSEKMKNDPKERGRFSFFFVYNIIFRLFVLILQLDFSPTEVFADIKSLLLSKKDLVFIG